MKVIVGTWPGATYEPGRHDAAWRYLESLDPDIALLQEAVPPGWAAQGWPGLVAAEKYSGSHTPWGSAILVKAGGLEPVLPTTDTYWLAELWGGTVTARATGLGDLLLSSLHSRAESRHPSEFPSDRIASVVRCHPEKVWEIERAAADLGHLFAGRRFIAGGDLNSSLLFDAVYHRDANAKLFANLAEAVPATCGRRFMLKSSARTSKPAGGPTSSTTSSQTTRPLLTQQAGRSSTSQRPGSRSVTTPQSRSSSAIGRALATRQNRPAGRRRPRRWLLSRPPRPARRK